MDRRTRKNCKYNRTNLIYTLFTNCNWLIYGWKLALECQSRLEVYKFAYVYSSSFPSEVARKRCALFYIKYTALVAQLLFFKENNPEKGGNYIVGPQPISFVAT